ncbi:hypothetical protein FACS18942_04300 [Planctomycetales bacterium]|nr:hypothetical protein FACS18942_04300 [Planctomycetales bacterium]
MRLLSTVGALSLLLIAFFAAGYGGSIESLYRQAFSKFERDIGKLEKEVAEFRQSVQQIAAKKQLLQWKVREKDEGIKAKNSELNSIDNELQFIKQSIAEGKPVRESLTQREIPAQELNIHIEKLAIRRQALVEVLSMFSASRATLLDELNKLGKEALSAPIHLYALESELSTAKVLLETHRDTLKTVGGSTSSQTLSERYENIKSGIQRLNAATAQHSSPELMIDFGSVNAAIDTDDAIAKKIEGILNGTK